MIVALLIMVCLALPAGAEETSVVSALPQEYREMLEALPDALRDSLPQDVLTSDPQAAGKAWQSLTEPKAFLDLILGTFGTHFGRYFKAFLALLGILLLRAVWNCLAASIRTAGLSTALGLLGRLVLFCTVAGQAVAILEEIVTFYEGLGALTGGFLPLLGAMYAMGGNVATAAANHSTLVLTFSLVEWLGGKTVVPLFSLCLAFLLLGVFEGSVAGRMQVLTGKLKKWYTTALGLVMLILGALLGAQTTLTARADSLGFRTVRFVVSSSIPMVGGGIADMLRTAAASLTWMRGIVGVGGIVLLLWLLLPPVISLLLGRAVCSAAEGVAGLLGCGEEGKLLSEVGSLYGYLLAVLCLSVLTFFFALVLLLHCGVAAG